MAKPKLKSYKQLKKAKTKKHKGKLPSKTNFSFEMKNPEEFLIADISTEDQDYALYLWKEMAGCPEVANEIRLGIPKAAAIKLAHTILSKLN